MVGSVGAYLGFTVGGRTNRLQPNDNHTPYDTWFEAWSQIKMM